MKFILLCDQKNIFKNKPFKNLDDGPLNIVSPLPTENVPINVGKLAAVGRNVVLQNIVESLSYTWSTQTRLVHIFVVGGIGKILQQNTQPSIYLKEGTLIMDTSI